jgi:hypothetical protein
MTHINTARPDATTLVTLGYLGICVLLDPAVHNAWREAAENCTRGVSSVARACTETAASWRRHGGTAPLSLLS